MALTALIGMHEQDQADLVAELLEMQRVEVIKAADMLAEAQAAPFDIYVMDPNNGMPFADEPTVGHIRPGIDVWNSPYVGDRVRGGDAVFLAVTGNQAICDLTRAQGIPAVMKPYGSRVITDLAIEAEQEQHRMQEYAKKHDVGVRFG